MQTHVIPLGLIRCSHTSELASLVRMRSPSTLAASSSSRRTSTCQMRRAQCAACMPSTPDYMVTLLTAEGGMPQR